jgi:hypothetical protein
VEQEGWVLVLTLPYVTRAPPSLSWISPGNEVNIARLSHSKGCCSSGWALL